MNEYVKKRRSLGNLLYRILLRSTRIMPKNMLWHMDYFELKVPENQEMPEKL